MLTMIQVLLRVAAWITVFGIGYLYFGPEVFRPSEDNKQVTDKPPLYMPPIKTQRLLALEKQLQTSPLSGNEADEYQQLVRKRQSDFWSNKDLTVEQALAGVKTQRKQRLIEILLERGISKDELVIYLAVAERDHAYLLEDRE